MPHHQAELAAFGERYWRFYRDLLAYKQAPTAAECTRLEDAFDTLVETESGYAALDDRIIKTADKRAQLLAVLKDPDIPLHNNDWNWRSDARCANARSVSTPNHGTGHRPEIPSKP